MEQFFRILWIDIKMQCRVPIALFFALIFPLLLLVIFTLAYDNKPIGEGYHFVDSYVLVTVVVGTLSTVLISLPLWIGESINDGVYKRLDLFGVDMKKVYFADITVYILLILCAIILNFSVATLFFDAKLPDFSHLMTYMLSLLYGLFMCSLIGLAVAFLAPNFKSVLPLGMITFFGFLILCGGFIPYQQLPEGMQKIADWIPVKYMMVDFEKIYRNETYFIGDFLALNTGWIVAMVAGLVLIYKLKGRRTLS